MDAQIKIETNGNGILINAVLPVWIREGADGKKYANIALLGVDTYGIDDDDLDTAIKDTITCFFKAALKHGKGIEEELKALGWKKERALAKQQTVVRSRKVSLWDMPASMPIFENIMDTGEPKAMKLQIAS